MSSSTPDLLFKPTACFVGKVETTSPSIGETTSPSVGSIANPSPIIFFENVGSGTFSSAVVFPLSGAKMVSTLLFWVDIGNTPIRYDYSYFFKSVSKPVYTCYVSNYNLYIQVMQVLSIINIIIRAIIVGRKATFHLVFDPFKKPLILALSQRNLTSLCLAYKLRS